MRLFVVKFRDVSSDSQELTFLREAICHGAEPSVLLLGGNPLNSVQLDRKGRMSGARNNGGDTASYIIITH